MLSEAVVDALNEGGVQKLLIEVGKPIKLERLVKRTADDPEVNVRIDNPYEAAKYSKMDELEIDDDQSYLMKLFMASAMLSSNGCRPVFLITSSLSNLRKRLGISRFVPVETVFGIESIEEVEVPEETDLLCGRLISENSEILPVLVDMTIRIPTDGDADE